MSTQARSNPKTQADREDAAQRLASDYGPAWRETYKPGSFGCHELLDRTSLIGDMVEEHVLGHPACVANPEWHALAERAVEALRELYQRVGQDHL